MNSKMNQSGLVSAVKPKPKATGHVERYITVELPGAGAYSAFGRMTIDEAKALRRELQEAIRAAGE